jgi:hypothetical protein
MKNTIKITALALLLSTGLFAATSAKANGTAPTIFNQFLKIFTL